jgi:integrase/recombinase XerD
MPEQLPLFSTPPEPTTPVAEAVPASTATPPEALGMLPSVSLSAAIVAWKDFMERQVARGELSPHTLKAFTGDLNQLAHFVGVHKGLNQITTRDLENWLQWQRTVKKCSPKTYARRVTTLKSFFRWLNQSSVLGTDPAAPIVQQTVLSPLPEFLSEAEVQAALQAAEAIRGGEKSDPRPYILFTLLLQTGIKKGECLALVPNHVDLSNPDEPVLWVRYSDSRHRYKERKLRLDPSWIPGYQAYLAQYEPRDRLFPWSARRLEYLLEDISQAAGLEKHLSFDMCRWTCAVRDARAGMEPDKIRQKLGLSKIQWREIGMKLNRLLEPGL